MSAALPAVAIAVIILSVGLIAALVVLWRRHRGAKEELTRLNEGMEAMKARLGAQKETLDHAFELTGLGTWAILPDLGVVRASRHVRTILGFSETEEMLPMDALRERIVAQDRADFEAALGRALNEKLATELEFRAVDAAGEIRVFRARTGPDGAMPYAREQGISGVVQDITDLRDKELALARSGKLERMAGEAAQVGGWRYDVETRMFTGSQEMAKIVGLDGGWHSGIDEVMDRLVPGENRVQMERSFWTCIGTGAPFDEIANFKKFDDGETWLRVIGEAERDASGKVIAACGAMQNVAEMICDRTAADNVRALIPTILNGLSDGFIIHDRDGTIQYIDRRAHTILGVPDLDLLGGNIWQDLPWPGDTPFKKAVTDALTTGKRQTLEGEISSSDQWVNVTVHPTKSGVAIYLNDVTGDRATRTRLRLLDAAMAQVSDVILITQANPLGGADRKVVYVNKAFVKMTGYSKQEIIGATPDILYGPSTECGRVKEIDEAIKNARPIRTELTSYRKDGSSFIVEADINPVFDEAGICTHFVSVQRDTTERRKAEQCLRASEEQFRLASQASQDTIWDWDMPSGIIWNSENSRNIFGAIPPSHVGMILAEDGGNGQIGDTDVVFGADGEKVSTRRIENMLERIHHDDRLRVTESLDAALAGDAQMWRCDYRIGTPDGAWRHICDKAFILRDDDGAPRRMVGAMSDVTEFRALDAQLHQAQKLEAVGQLTGGIAHDFNNLITIILGNCDILLDDVAKDSKLRPLLQSIEDAADRAARVSSDLLAFSRLQSLELRATDINDLILRSSGLFERAVDASVDIRYELTKAPVVARVDSTKLQTALLNLIINAKDAMADGGCITVVTRIKTIADAVPHGDVVPGEYVEIDVIDNGTGMTTKVAEHAFEPFFTTKEPGLGTGMGLSSVYGFVKQCGGHAEIESEPGKGTTITVSLPVAENVGQKESAPAADAPESCAGDGERLLVVEDNSELRDYVCKVLTRKGYRIVEAENGEMALAILQKDDGFDLLLTDIVMPGTVNGVQVAQAAREMYPECKVLFMSGYARNALPKERDVPSDVPMLAKPFRARELIACIKTVLSRKASRGT